MVDKSAPSCRIISLSIYSDQTSETYALGLAKRIGLRCETLLIEETPSTEIAGSRQSQHMMRRHNALIENATRIGVSNTVNVENLAAAFGIINAQTEQIWLLAQPRHPADRLAHEVLKIGAALQASPSSVIYVPSHIDPTNGNADRMLLTNDALASHPHVMPIIASGLMPQTLPSYVHDMSALVAYYRSLPPSQRPALLVIADEAFSASPSVIMKTAERLGIPILVV